MEIFIYYFSIWFIYYLIFKKIFQIQNMLTGGNYVISICRCDYLLKHVFICFTVELKTEPYVPSDSGSDKDIPLSALGKKKKWVFKILTSIRLLCKTILLKLFLVICCDVFSPPRLKISLPKEYIKMPWKVCMMLCLSLLTLLFI